MALRLLRPRQKLTLFMHELNFIAYFYGIDFLISVFFKKENSDLVKVSQLNHLFVKIFSIFMNVDLGCQRETSHLAYTGAYDI